MTNWSARVTRESRTLRSGSFYIEEKILVIFPEIIISGSD